jgi:HK97 family phage portal protein
MAYAQVMPPFPRWQYPVSCAFVTDLIVVRDFRSRDALPPRDNLPNSNPPLGTVGPNVPEGFGDTHVNFSALNPPMEAQAWAGWPVLWDTPNWGGAANPQLVSTLGTCIDLNTRELASFPVYGMKGPEVTKLPEWSNNPEPEVYSDWTEAAKQLFNTLQGSGEAILWATGRFGLHNDGAVARWVVLNPEYVNIEWADGDVKYSLQGSELDSADVVHIKYQSYPMNLRGLGPLQWAARNIIGAMAMEQMGMNLASRSGIPWAVLKHPRRLNGTEATDLQNRWVTAAKTRSGAPAILSGGIEIQTLTISPREMALLDMRIFDETRIAAALGVPPYLVGLPQSEGMTYANVQAIFDYHWRATLRPLANTVAGALSYKWLPRGTRLEFNRDEYVRPGMYERAQTYEILNRIRDVQGNPAMTIDEIRLGERFLPNKPVSVEDMEGAIP